MAKNVINSLVFPFFEDDARESVCAIAMTDSKRMKGELGKIKTLPWIRNVMA